MHSSRPTLSFFLLVAIAAIASFGALVLTDQLSPEQSETAKTEQTLDQTANTDNREPAQIPDGEPNMSAATINTATWEEYTNPTYYLSFKHPNDWTVETFPDRAGYYVIAVRPKRGSDSIRIYINPTHYSGLAGLPSKAGKVAGIRAINVNDITIGVKYAAQFYTFDLGTDLRLQPAFKAMLNTVAFSK